ncbi:MAG: hypothetical protein FDX30_06235 [Chlorobium sp.]|nr:MAG: hypothetical protein FDX30_06235 [Chlorobium sp.]
MNTFDVFKWLFPYFSISSLVTALLLWLTREWMSNKLKNSISHEYDEKLENYKAYLKKENDLLLLNIKNRFERETTIHNIAGISISEVQKVVVSRKIEAIESLWHEVLRIKKNMPSIKLILDIITIDEYKTIINNNYFKKELEKLDEKEIIKMMGDLNEPTEKNKIYIDNNVWALFFAYRAIMVRIVLLMTKVKVDPGMIEWFNDELIQNLLLSVLSPEENIEYKEIKISKISWLQEKIETKILDRIQIILSGKDFGKEAVIQSKMIIELSTKINDEIKIKKNKEIFMD